MGKLLREVNEFFNSTSIHGFSYISDTQTRSTRIIWTVIVIAALGGASYFLYQTVEGFDEKYVSTTIETRGIQEFPFPAVTFYPGQFNSEKGLLRTFLNQFEFTRYVDKRDKNTSPLEDNDKFMNLFGWLISPMHNDLFNDVQEFVLNDKTVNNNGKTFLQDKGKIFRNEACSLTALYQKKIKLDKEIIEIYELNMYKFNFFPDLVKIIKKQVSPIIQDAIRKQNLTKADISKACNDEKNLHYKTKIESLLVSYMYLFIDEKNTVIGAGDLAVAAQNLPTGLSRGDFKTPYSAKYVPTHTLLTNMYNEMFNGSLPVSVLTFPSFFVLPDKIFMEKEWKDRQKWKAKKIKNRLELLNIPDEAVRNYHYLWDTFNNNKKNFTLFCLEEKNKAENCSSKSPFEFLLAENPTHFARVASIRKNPAKGILVEGEANEPPCTNPSTIKNFKIEPLCNFFKKLTLNKDPFLTAMMFTKQDPVFLLEEDEIQFMLSNTSISQFGYSLKKSRVSFHI